MLVIVVSGCVGPGGVALEAGQMLEMPENVARAFWHRGQVGQPTEAEWNKYHGVEVVAGDAPPSETVAGDALPSDLAAGRAKGAKAS